MKIKCLTAFLEGAERFEKDDIRTVDDARGAYFVEQGWALNEDGELQEPFVGEVNLDIKNNVIGVKGSKLDIGESNG
jgi:hypothetical protein